MTPLTPREQEVWHLLTLRLTNQEISAVLGVGVRTTEHHVAQIKAKLGATNRRQVAPVASRSPSIRMEQLSRAAETGLSATRDAAAAGAPSTQGSKSDG